MMSGTADAAFTHTLPYLLYRRNIRAYTAPPMHSGYRRYDRYFMAYREMCKTHYSTTTKGHCVFSNNSLVFRWKKAHQCIILFCSPLWLIRFSILFTENAEIATKMSGSLHEKCSLSHSHYAYNKPVYSVSLIQDWKHHTWNVGLPPFQETWILKAFFTFHTFKIKARMTDQPFIEL